MKKLVSLLLTLAMLASLAFVGVQAEEEDVVATAPLYSITDGKATIGGVEYTEITDLSALTTAGNYILGADITAEITTATAIVDGVVLEGNGYSLTNVKVGENGLFTFAADSTTEIRNLTIGSEEAPATATKNLIDKNEQVSITSTWTNVDVYVALTHVEGAQNAVFFPRPKGTLTFTNCDIVVTPGEAASIMGNNCGGFVGRCNANVTFTNCSVDGTLMSAKNYGAFVGKLDNGYKVTITECVNSAAVSANANATSGNAIGSAVGMNQGELVITSYLNAGDVTSDSPAPVGGIVGINDANGTVSLVDCVNMGTVSTNDATVPVGGIVGYNKGAVTYRFVENLGELVAAADGMSGDFVGKADEGATLTEDVVAIATYDELVAALVDTQEEGSYFRLSADIDFTGKTPAIHGLYLAPGSILDGNGKSFLNVTITGGADGADGIFGFAVGDDTVEPAVVTNLTIGSEAAPVASNCAIVADYEDNAKFVTAWENVTIYATLTNTTHAGAFFGRPAGEHVFVDCTVNMNLDNETTNGIGGFIGRTSAKTYFDGCTVNGTIKAKGNMGGLIGKLDSGEVYITDTTINANVTAINGASTGNGVGALLGLSAGAVYASGIEITGTVVTQGDAPAGAMVGNLQADLVWMQPCTLPEGIEIAGAVADGKNVTDATPAVEIDAIEDAIFTQPVENSALVTEAVVGEDVGFTAGTISWVDEDNNAATTAKKGYTYTATVVLTVADVEDAYVSFAAELTVPTGITAEVAEDGATVTLTYTYTVPGEKETEPTTTVPTEPTTTPTEDNTTTPTTDAPADDKEEGCKSVVGGMAVIMLVAGAAVAVVARKKED